MRTSHMTDQEFEQFVLSHPVSGGKGSDSAKAVRDKEFAMQKQAFDKQMAQLDKLNSAFSKYLTKNIGFDPAQKAAMTSQFLNNNDSSFNQAGQMVREALGARGNKGDTPIGGDTVRGLSGLLGARAGSQSEGLLNVNLQDAAQALANRFNAGSILSGNAATLTGPQGIAGSAMSNALNRFMEAENSGFGASFLSSFGTGLGGTLGKGLGGFAMGGLGKLTGNLGQQQQGCWIAAACFDGWDDPRTIAVRSYLNGDFLSHWYGKIVMAMYLRFGEWIAQKNVLVKLLRPLFNFALTKAMKHGVS